MTRISFEPILIGSRRYGVNEDDSDYDYLLLVPESRVTDVLSLWGECDIIEYTNVPDLSATLPVDARYRIKGIANDDVAHLLHIPEAAPYDILLVSRPDRITDSNYILENVGLYRMLRVDDVSYTSKNIHPDLKMRVKAIRLWAKKNGVYGGAYPDGMGYFIYAINTMKKGYSLEKSIRMLSTRCLYYHDEYKYRHISYVSEKSMKHIANTLNNKIKIGTYQYQVRSNRMEETLKLIKKLLDETPGVMYVENTGIIHASEDVSESIKKWAEWLHKMDIEARVIEMK